MQGAKGRVIEAMAAPIRVGLVGTGYAAKKRAEALVENPRSHLVAVAGRTPETVNTFASEYQATPCPNWQALVAREDLDLVVVANANWQHSAIARAALQANKHVVVEYPLALNLAEAQALAELAAQRQKLLHVEHIELLGGLHQAIRQHLPSLGQPAWARYATLKPQHPAPRRWTYHPACFGFPLIGALSRLSRLVDLFGEVATVICQAQVWQTGADASGLIPRPWSVVEAGWEKGGCDRATPNLDHCYQACLCKAQLQFANGTLADVVYGKGECCWQAERCFEIHGSKAGLIFQGDQGQMIQPDATQPIEVGKRRGLFVKETALILEHLQAGTPLYVSLNHSLRTLRIAEAAKQAAITGQPISSLVI